MHMKTALLFTWLCALVAGCGGGGGGDDDGDDPREDDEQVCNDRRYDDGACDVDLACAAPDIDCFTFASSQADAEEIFLDFEQQVAAQEGRQPRRIVPSSDPQFRAMRRALDDGWDAYRKAIPVADLADHDPALVVIEDPSINAFVFGSRRGTANFIVVVHTGTLDQNPSEAALAGLVMHELTHAVGLHVVPGGDALFRRFYVAAGEEPLGFEQDEDPIALEHGEAWRSAASDAGPFVAPELGGFPFTGTMELLLNFGVANIPQCATARGIASEMRDDLVGGLDFLDVSLQVPANVNRQRADNVMANLADCVEDAGVDGDFFDLVAAFTGSSADVIRGQVSAADRTLLDGKPFIIGMRDLLISRRAEMREIEAAFEADTDESFAALRFFSTEENADDITVPVLEAMDLDIVGLGQFLFGVLDNDSQVRCQQLLANQQTPPYGADLNDEHHATCWRIAHVVQVANSGQFPDPGVRSDKARKARKALAARPPLVPRPPIAY
jgi:hypothetical protein